MTHGEEARIVAMETRLAHQENSIDTLNAAITDQWTKIDQLSRQMAELRERLQLNPRRPQGRAMRGRRIIEWTGRHRRLG